MLFIVAQVNPREVRHIFDVKIRSSHGRKLEAEGQRSK
jgi:hypothetical protein